MEELRKYVRIPEDSQILYKVIPSEKSGEYLTKDISQGGIRFLVHSFIPKDSNLRVRLTLHNADVAIEALVRLVWIKEVPHSERYEVGVRFIDIPPKATEYLINYIRSALSTQR